MARPAQTEIDPEFWDRLREALDEYMASTGLNQKALSARLGLDPTTLNNFLNRQSNSIGGLAVALACTLINLTCNGSAIGRLDKRPRKQSITTPQLILEFDSAFDSRRKSKLPIVVLRKAASQSRIRLSIRKVS